MFDFLKKKIADFTGKIKEAINAKPAEAQKAAEPEKPVVPQEPTPAAPQEIAQPTPVPRPQDPEPKPQVVEHPKEAEKPKAAAREPEKKKTGGKIHTPHAPAPESKPAAKPAPQIPKIETPKPVQKPQPLQKAQPAPQPVVAEPKAPEPAFEIAGEKKAAIEKATQIREDEKRELKAKVGLASKIFGFVGGKIKITEKETQNFFDEFELSLLEGDVQQDAAEAIVKELRGRLVGKEISSREDVTEFLKREVKGSLAAGMKTEQIDVLALCGKHKPLRIMFLGPNGAGKTTSIAKIANYFMKHKKSVILAAGDTFRAASIEQLEAHGNALGVKVVKHKYGSDPAAVAFDAVKAAEAKGIDVVLIDTAGRQETNKNLIEELKKIGRVVKPDLKLYVGEAFTGQALLNQASEFDRAIGLSGFVLTKIDNDTKGGTAISLLHSLRKPIVFVGTGQRYDDLLEFRPEFIIDRII